MSGKYSFYCTETLGGCLLQQFAYPDGDVELLVRECPFPSLSHHGWNIPAHSTDGEFGQGDVDRRGVTRHTATLLLLCDSLLLLCHHLETNKLQLNPGPEDKTPEDQQLGAMPSLAQPSSR